MGPQKQACLAEWAPPRLEEQIPILSTQEVGVPSATVSSSQCVIVAQLAQICRGDGGSVVRRKARAAGSCVSGLQQLASL